MASSLPRALLLTALLARAECAFVAPPAPGRAPGCSAAAPAAAGVRPAMVDLDAAAFGLADGQRVGSTAPAHPAEKPWTNLEKQESVQLIKARSDHLRAPLQADMANDEIFVSPDSIHILKHHGSYMQQNRDVKKKSERDQTYQFMLRLKMPVGEVPADLFRKLDDLSNKYGQGDLRATTRQAFQLHGVVKSNLKQVIADIANAGSNTYGGCGDINRNVMAPPVHFPNNPACAGGHLIPLVY